MNRKKSLSRFDRNGIDCLLAVIALTLVPQPIWANDVSSEYRPRMFRYAGYAERLKKQTAHTLSQINERSERRKADIDILRQTAQRLHRGATKINQVESTYLDFESALQKAADELDTGEPPKSGWAVELISCYTRPTHKWPAVSPTLDKALRARELLVQLTNEQTVNTIEQQLYRFATPEDKSRYYRISD